MLLLFLASSSERKNTSLITLRPDCNIIILTKTLNSSFFRESDDGDETKGSTDGEAGQDGVQAEGSHL